MKSYTIKYILALSFLLSLVGCVEPFDIETENFESALVIEATITNEYKNQEIKLSRTYALDGEGPNPESGAQVKVTDISGNSYQFQEEEPGVYISLQQFSARKNNSYQLKITTSNGRMYSSESAIINGDAEIETMDIVKSSQTINGAEQDGLAIVVVSNEDNSQYYRYTYEETYEFRSLYRIGTKFVVENGVLNTVPKEENDYLCYVTKNSKNIILSTSSNTNSNSLSRFPVKFLNKNDYSIAYRYSLLAKKHSLSLEAYNFYAVLNELSGSESLFSQTQPGFVNGNIYSLDNDDEKVLGFFNVSAVASQRIFFNFTDFYNIEERPAYPYVCEITTPEFRDYDGLVNAVESGLVGFIGNNDGDEDSDGPFRVAPITCIDCRLFGDNVKPDFWED